MRVEVKDWQSISYADHFADSMFSDKKLAVLAYKNAHSAYRKPFDWTTKEINVKVKDDIVEIEKVQLTGNPDHLLEAVKTITKDVQRLVDRTRAIINGDFSKEELVEPVTLDQGDIDALFD